MNTINTVIICNQLLINSSRNSIKNKNHDNDYKHNTPNYEDSRSKDAEAASSKAIRSNVLGGINAEKNTFTRSNEAPKLENYLEGINCSLISKEYGISTNESIEKENIKDARLYSSSFPVLDVKLAEDTKFCRLYNDENIEKNGNWLVKPKDIEGLSAEEIQFKFEMPNMPTKICDVTVPEGTEMRIGVCDNLKSWVSGNGIQYDLKGQEVGVYDNEREIPAKE